MIKYPIFYRHYGTRLLKHLVNPRVIDASTLEFPVRSVFYNYMVSDVATDISKDDIFLKQASQVAVYTASEYSVEVLGSLRRLPKILNVIITEMAKKEKRLVFKKPNSAPPIESPRLLIVHHYGMLGEFYRYNINNLNRYFKFKNTLGTVVHDLSLYLAEQPNIEEAKHVFLKFDIPNQLPSRRELDIYSKNMNPMFLKKLPNYRYLNVLELWKLLTPEYRSESIFSKIPVNQLSKIDLLITIDAKVTIVNLGLLMSLVKDYNLNISSEELEEDIKLVGELTTEDLKIKQKFKPDIVKKLLYVFLYRIINVKFKDKPSKTKQENQDKQNLSETTTSLLVEDDGTDNDLTVDLDKILENDILEADSGDEEDSEFVKEKQITINRTRTSDRDLTVDDDDDIDYGMDYDADTDVINISETLSNSETVTTYNSVDEVYKEEPNDYLNAIRNIEILFDSGIISKKERNNLEDILERQKSLTSTYVTGKSDKLIDILDPSTDSYEVGVEDCSITSSPGVPDPTLNKNKVGTIDKKYISKQYKKDIMRVFYSLQKHNCVLENYEILERDSVLGGEETHMVTLRLYTGRRIKFSIVLPTINEDGTFKMSSNTYRMRKQRTELPIRRINDNQVVLNSYYTKLFLERAVQKQFDKGYRFFKKISYLFQNTDTVVAMSPANGEPNYDVTMPSQYAYIARYLLSFKTQNALYHFNYKTRKSILNTDIDIEKIEGKEYILIGVTTNNDPIFINFNNELFHYRNNQFLKVDDLLTQLGISQSELPSEYATLKIMKERVPVVLILSYYIGLQNLLKLTGIKYEVHEINARVTYNPSTHYIVKFKDKKLLLPYTNTYLDLIFNGLIIVSKFIKDNVNLDSLNTKDGYSSIFAYLKYKQYVQTEIKLLENMFVDPITMSILKEMKEPITFKGLLIRATEIMSIENFKHPNHMEGTAIKGYERIAGLTYNTLITALKNYENTAYFSKGSFTINPYCIKNVILDDSTTVLVDDLNPVSFLKQQEDVTYLGAGGRGSRLSMSRDTRIMHESEVGIVSEGVKDNGDVGITFYLSADPNINNIRGIAEPTTAEKTSWAGILSSTAVLFPFSRTDDVKRISKFVLLSSNR